MNCQDISRLIDSGSFSALPETQRREGEAHARGCRHCAPLWFAHAPLATMHIPPMPAEFAVRCLTLAAARTAAQPRASRRTIVVVGSLIVLAAAASMLAAKFIPGTELPTEPAAPVLAQVVEPAQPEHSAQVSIPTIEAKPEPSPDPETPAKPARAGLPLLPAPLSLAQERNARSQMAMQKALELYPQLTAGPEIDDIFVVSLMLRADGKVLSNAMEITTEEKLPEVAARLSSLAMNAAGNQTSTGSRKGRTLPDGRVLRGDLSLQFSFVPITFDPAKSQGRVQEIVRASRAHLMLPPGREGLNHLTVFLAEDGTIQREFVELRRPEDLRPQAQGNSDAATTLAKTIADKLGLRVEEIGATGFAYLIEGAKPAPEESGNVPAVSPPRALTIEYAWPRRAHESAPTLGQARFLGTGVDTAAALVIVERMLPEAFLMKDSHRGTPTVVLTAEGEVIRAEYVKIEDLAAQFQNLEPGRVDITSEGSVDLVNSAGVRVEFQFIWQLTAAQRAATEAAP